MKALSGVPRKDLTWTAAPLVALDLTGLRAAVVGGTGGIGRALAVLLASRGAQVIVVGQTFRDEGQEGLRFLKADLSLMAEAIRVGRELPAEELDLVVLTTGIFAGPRREETAEGIERDMAISYLSRLAIVREIGPRLGKRRAASDRKPRIFVMGFPGTGQKGDPADLNAEKSYASTPVHMNTVAANESLVLDGAARYPGVGFYGLNPGLIQSNIRSNVLGGEGSWRQRAVEWLIGMLMMSAEAYAERTVPLLVSPDLEPCSGAMFNQKGRAILQSPELTTAHVAQFLAASEALLRRAAPQPPTISPPEARQ